MKEINVEVESSLVIIEKVGEDRRVFELEFYKLVLSIEEINVSYVFVECRRWEKLNERFLLLCVLVFNVFKVCFFFLYYCILLFFCLRREN